MSSYRGRHGPNFSQYLSDLNTLSPQDNQVTEGNDFSNDLAMYTNTDFTNLDMPGSLAEDDGFNWDLATDNQNPDDVKYEELLGAPDAGTDFGNFGGVETAPVPPQPAFYPTYNTPIQPAPATGFPQAEQTSHNVVPMENRRSRAGTMQTVDHMSVEEKSKVAAEEDKRRRNTAASARFRVKKKQREQALERTLKEAQDKSSKLEARVSQLETENRWLKNLITEKNGLSSKEEIAAAYERHRKESEERDLSKQSGRTQGVGTS